MMTRSIRFRLTVWYAGLLAILLVLFGGFIYLTLEKFLERNLSDTLAKEAQTIGESWLRDVNQTGPGYVASEIEEHFAPSITGRFVRITRGADGSDVYHSSAPESGAFDPKQIGPKRFNASQSLREEHLPNDKELLIFSLPFPDRAGNQYLIETGAPYDQVERVLRSLLISFGIAFPLIVGAAIGGGYLLMRNALRPINEIATTAERITSRNLNQRLPVVPTGDEIERLSVSLNRMMERLEDAFHHISRFSADAAHEIRTPLAIIRGELENALQTYGLTVDLRETLGSALEEAERLSRIVEQLLEMSRLEAGETLVERTRFDFTEMTKNTVDQMGLLAEEKKLQLEFRGNRPVDVEGDPIRLKQIVVNLVDNAIKYTPPGGSISVSTFPQDGKVILEVADTGIGIPNEATSQIFDRFFRADRARSRQLGGTGLGLAIVKSICIAYDGTVSVKSAEGKGTTFRVELPLEKNHEVDHA
jgi:two-component system OmpR family sensor kinase